MRSPVRPTSTSKRSSSTRSGCSRRSRRPDASRRRGHDEVLGAGPLHHRRRLGPRSGDRAALRRRGRQGLRRRRERRRPRRDGGGDPHGRRRRGQRRLRRRLDGRRARRGGRGGRRLRRRRHPGERGRHRPLRPARGDRRGGVAAGADREPHRRVQHGEGGAPAPAGAPGRRRRERRLERGHARPGLRGALRSVEGGARQLHPLDRARVREPRPADQLPRTRRHPLAADPALHPARGLREAARRVLLAAPAAPAGRPRGHGEGDRLSGLRRRQDGGRRGAGRRLGYPRVVSDTILDALARDVAARGAHPFILHEGRAVSYAELDQLANAAARALAALGVVRGDRVTLALGNSIEYLVAAFAALKAGGVLNPVNPALGAAELGYLVRHAEPRVVVTGASHVETFRRHGSTVVTPEALAGSDTTAPPLTVGAEDSALLLYTSGTTGNPKGVLFTHGTSGRAGRHFLQTLHITADDVVLAVTPLFHGNAWGAVQTALHAGGTVAFPAAFHASAFWPLVQATGATVLYTLGTILAMLLARPESNEERASRLRVILGLGSAPIRERVIERFGVADVAECYGSTDAGVVTITPVGVPPRAGSCGPPVPGVEIRILDDDGHALPARAVGEIAVRSPSRMT